MNTENLLTSNGDNGIGWALFNRYQMAWLLYFTFAFFLYERYESSEKATVYM